MAKAEIGLRNTGQARILLETEFREKGLVKQVPGARWDNEMKVWHVPISFVSCVQIASIFGKSLEVGEKLRAFAKETGKLRKTIVAAKDDDTFIDERLYDMQTNGVNWMEAGGRGVVADEMGSGKTVQICVMLERMPRERPHLIICPNTLVKVWRDHVADWTTLTPIVVEGSAKKRDEAILAADAGDVLIINYEKVMLHSRLRGYGSIALRKCGDHGGDPDVKPAKCEVHDKPLNEIDWDCVVLDEAHRIKDPKAKTTRAVWAVRGHHNFALTGTPIANHPGDYWSLLHFVDPDEWPSRGQYVDRYCATSWSPFGGLDIVGIRGDTKKEFKKITESLMIRRLKPVDIGKVYLTRYVQLPPKMRKVYKQMKENLIAEVDGGFVMAKNHLAATTRLIQASCAMIEQIGDDEYGMVDNPKSPKVTEMMQILEDIGEDEPLVVFSSSKKLLYLAKERLNRAGISHGMVTGDQDRDERGEAVDRFQAGQLRVILLTTAAGSEGITLTRARNMVFLQRDWSMVKNLQAEDRIHRIGQEAASVNIITVIAEDTLDERVFDVYGDKLDRLGEIVDQEFNVNELKELA